MKKQPLVSVIIPVYNRLLYIGEAIESVLNQTYKNYEIIVIDDGSTLNIRKVLGPYKNKIKYLYQKNRGLAAARNKGIRNSLGKYLAFLDDDDTFEPRKLEIQVSLLEKNNQIGFTFSDYLRFEAIEDKEKLSFATGKDESTIDFVKLFFLNPNVAVPTLLIRRQCFKEVGLFDENLRQHEDGDMFLRIALKWLVKFSDYPSARVRFHPHKMSSNRIEMNKSLINSSKKILAQYPKFRESLGVNADKRMAELYYCLGTELFYIGKYKAAIKNYRISRQLSNKYINIKNITSVVLKHILKEIKNSL